MGARIRHRKGHFRGTLGHVRGRYTQRYSQEVARGDAAAGYNVTDRISEEGNAIDSVRLSVCLSVCFARSVFCTERLDIDLSYAYAWIV